jgi:hypothetical protein
VPDLSVAIADSGKFSTGVSVAPVRTTVGDFRVVHGLHARAQRLL